MSVIDLAEVRAFIRDYITNCGFSPVDWDVDSWAETARDWMYAHGLTSCDDIDPDKWTEMAIAAER